MKIKGFIFALGRWSRADQPLSNQPFSGIPVILFALHSLVLLGIKKILICSTPKVAAKIHSIVDRTDWKADISYLLTQEDTSVTNAISLATEFFEQSQMLLLGAGVYCSGKDLSEQFESRFKSRSGVTSFHVRSGMVDDHCPIPDILLLDVRSRRKLLNTPASDIEELRRYCRMHFKFYEVRLPEQCFYINLLEAVTVNDAALRDRELIKNVKLLCELLGQSKKLN